MPSCHSIVGVDVGSVTIALAEIDREGRLLHTAYAFHRGDIRGALRAALREIPAARVAAIATTDRAGAFVPSGEPVDVHVAHIAAATRRHGRVGTILVLGGERFSLIRFDAEGRYRGTRTNGSCAAGTGAFLDQHAATAGLADAAALSAAALESKGVAPPIASRCAVFAKTDLIHAQQQGYPLPAICDGLCDGLAAIVADTVHAGAPLVAPLVLSGGVALNVAVRQHLARRLGLAVVSDDEPHLHAAHGAALVLQQRMLEPATGLEPLARPPTLGAADLAELVLAEEPERAHTTYYPPLGPPGGDYPDFSAHERYLFTPRANEAAGPVEVDSYEGDLDGRADEAILGIDVGSTSTKAVLLDASRRVLVGVYTRTAGRPIAAVQSLLEALDDWRLRAKGELRIAGAATTGAGRKLAGAVIGADHVVDEISAHARAAYELCPDVDTIIEIGGQDAKFTTMQRGLVTAAIMNTVCAAGTGSFIEEQARALGCDLAAYAEQVTGVAAPLASDRCTVFMQRDVNHLLGAGYAVPEVLATVLHSVRENYLHKVAREASIGHQICFQGATAKNRALVAAFEQRLRRPILVSRYCHLTGALGAALLLADQSVERSTFRGLGLGAERIELETERCELCRNACVITTARMRGERVAYGFRCDRDLDTERYVSNNRAGFDLLRARRAAERRVTAAAPVRKPPSGPTIGIPAALQLHAELPLWRRFFAELGVHVVTSESLVAPTTRGKQLAEAPFCAPVTAFHAHVADLAERADHVFLPALLESSRSSDPTRRQYCYYSQFASPLGALMADGRYADRLLRPLLADSREGPRVAALHEALRPVLGPSLRRSDVERALDRASAHANAVRAELRRTMVDAIGADPEIAVVLLGRPYCCLVPSLNKGIPEIISSLGVKVFFQDMLRIAPGDADEIAPLLGRVHWHYAAEILAASCAVAKATRLYPILVTSFKCAPDSTIVDQARQIFDRYGKPYLVLELDEHDSAIGYETRVEAGLRAFRNHHAARRGVPRMPTIPPPRPAEKSPLAGKTLWLPRWDELASTLLAAHLNHRGVRTEVLEDGPDTTARSMQLNRGQCIPLTIIAQGFIDAVERSGLDPAETAVWTIDSRISCHLGMFPTAIRALLDAYGRGFERASVYSGDLSFADITMRGAMDTYFAYMAAGYLRRLGCRTRPYERRPGATDDAMAASLATFCDAVVGRRTKRGAVKEVVDRFATIEVTERDRPKVAIFGDLYTRDNDQQNQGLVRFIEQHGGEVITTPYTEYMKVIARSYFRKWWREGKRLAVAVNQTLLSAALVMERNLTSEFARVLGPLPAAEASRVTDAALEPFGVTMHHTGESFDNLVKIASILRHDPDVRLFVQANPAFCCPSLVSEAMAGRIEQVTGVPVVTVTYDGTYAAKNDAIVPYLEFARRAMATAN